MIIGILLAIVPPLTDLLLMEKKAKSIKVTEGTYSDIMEVKLFYSNYF